MTLNDLIEQLTDLRTSLDDDADPEVRLAHQPRWPFEYSVGTVTLVGATGEVEEEEDREEEGDQDETIIYIGEGTQLGYLSGVASKELGWK